MTNATPQVSEGTGSSSTSPRPRRRFGCLTTLIAGAVVAGATYGVFAYVTNIPQKQKPQELLYMDLDSVKHGSEQADDIVINYGDGNIEIRLRNAQGSYDTKEDLFDKTEKTKDGNLTEAATTLEKQRNYIRENFTGLEAELDNIK